MLTVLAARAAGATRVFLSDPNTTRLDLARTIDPEVVTLDPREGKVSERVRAMTEGGVGADNRHRGGRNERALGDCVEAVRRQGTVVQLGLHPGPSKLDWFSVTCKDIDIGAPGPIPRRIWPRVIDLIASGRLPAARVVTKRIPSTTPCGKVRRPARSRRPASQDHDRPRGLTHEADRAVLVGRRGGQTNTTWERTVDMSETLERPVAGEARQTISDARRKAESWLTAFETGARRRDADAAAALFATESFWRDLVAFTWNIKTVEGPDGVRDLLTSQLPHVSASGFALEEEPTEDGGSSPPGSPSRRMSAAAAASCASRTARPGPS